MSRDIHSQNQILSYILISIDYHIHFIIKESQIQTDVGRSLGFPSQVLVTECIGWFQTTLHFLTDIVESVCRAFETVLLTPVRTYTCITYLSVT